jgi:nucleotide sugar dehydrogenase
MKNKIKSDIKKHKIIFSIYGLGNVGAPIAAVWLRAGAKVIGVDISTNLLNDIKNGSSHKKEPFVSKVFTNGINNKSFSITNDGITASKNSDVKIIIVPVAISKGKADFNALISVSKSISKGLKKGDTVIVCPSLPPNTTEKIILPLLEQGSNLKGEKDFYLIYNPERIYEGRAIADIEKNYPAIIAGLGKKSIKRGSSLLKIISQKGVLELSSLATAEAEKLFEGVYRDVNIALANELTEYCEKIGINYWEIKNAANSQPYCHLHYPGTGVGGLCIPVYPKIILESANTIGTKMEIVQKARKFNDLMPKKCVISSLKFLQKNKKIGKNVKIAVLGLGFRGDVTDSRLSPTYDVVKEFLKQKFEVTVHDPYIFQDKKLPKKVLLTKNFDLAISNADLIFISTDHKIYSKLDSDSFNDTKKPLLIFDGRNILNKPKFQNNLIKTLGIN